MPCKPSDLAEVQLFELLDENELAELAAVIDNESHPAGETIFAGRVRRDMNGLEFGTP